MSAEAICPKCSHPGIAVTPLTSSQGRAGEWITVPLNAPPPLLAAGPDVPGLVQARVCTKCGFTELYCRDAHRLQPMARTARSD